MDWVRQALDKNKLGALVNLAMHLRIVRSEILTAMVMKIQVFWDLTSFRMANRCRHFEGS